MSFYHQMPHQITNYTSEVQRQKKLLTRALGKGRNRTQVKPKSAEKIPLQTYDNGIQRPLLKQWPRGHLHCQHPISTPVRVQVAPISHPGPCYFSWESSGRFLGACYPPGRPKWNCSFLASVWPTRFCSTWRLNQRLRGTKKKTRLNQKMRNKSEPLHLLLPFK